jgi:hypothetical protein
MTQTISDLEYRKNKNLSHELLITTTSGAPVSEEHCLNNIARVCKEYEAHAPVSRPVQQADLASIIEDAKLHISVLRKMDDATLSEMSRNAFTVILNQIIEDCEKGL